jgi:pyruvate formate lyase activating enzyme
VLSEVHKFPIKGFIETSFLDWRGELSSVIFFGGCNFRCPFCHNSDLVIQPEQLEDVYLEYIILVLRKYKQWVNRVVVTGGEPTIHLGLFNTLGYLKREGMKVKLDTNGSSPSVLRGLVNEGLVDYVAMDVKGPIDRYSKWCGVDVDHNKIEESIRFIMDSGLDYEFRMTVVPELHREDDVYEVAEYLRSAEKFYLQEFKPRKCLQPSFLNIKPFSSEIFEKIDRNVKQIRVTGIKPEERVIKFREKKAHIKEGK